MKPSRTQVMMLIACLFVIAVPVVAQTSTPPVTMASAASPSMPLPDAPSAQRRSSAAPPSGLAPIANPEVKDKQFFLVNGVMFASSIANVELTARCFNSGACTAVPGPLRSRGALYGLGLPADVGATVLGYYLKRSGHRWWFVPAAAVTAGNVVYAIHAARQTR